jgi:hypothetical protein
MHRHRGRQDRPPICCCPLFAIAKMALSLYTSPMFPELMTFELASVRYVLSTAPLALSSV